MSGEATSSLERGDAPRSIGGSPCRHSRGPCHGFRAAHVRRGPPRLRWAVVALTVLPWGTAAALALAVVAWAAPGARAQGAEEGRICVASLPADLRAIDHPTPRGGSQ